MANERQINIRVYGLVQGVGFRYSVKKFAKQLNIKGWVHNELDGSVRVLAIGTEYNLKKLINWCYHGPYFAKVKNVKIEKQSQREFFKEFKIKL